MTHEAKAAAETCESVSLGVQATVENAQFEGEATRVSARRSAANGHGREKGLVSAMVW